MDGRQQRENIPKEKCASSIPQQLLIFDHDGNSSEGKEENWLEPISTLIWMISCWSNSKEAHPSRVLQIYKTRERERRFIPI